MKEGNKEAIEALKRLRDEVDYYHDRPMSESGQNEGYREACQGVLRQIDDMVRRYEA